ncbi:O-antigen ligase family protein [Butyrivibrio sp. VCB2006]|uniref:O-antigen ligase family protein n=1 Tax=Butyrivibrio sp. VCB2006 TaxID=1280679 RepID=UPI000416A184|nr:O-antigen ligase family protein [Butyrivibrio sp. VCB2006]
MTIFGVIWALIMLYCFKKADIKYMFFATLIFMTFQCANVLYLHGSSGVGPQVLTSICFIAKFFISSKFKFTRIRKDKSLLASLSLVALAILIIVSGYKNSNLSETLLVIFQLFVYMIAFLLMRRTAKSIGKENLYKLVRTIIIFVVAVGVIQWSITRFVPAAKILLKYIFYSDNSTDVYFNHNDAYHNGRIYSTFMEPSYMAAFAVGAFYYLVCFWNRLKENIALLIMLVIIIVASLSSTAYGAFIITGLIFIVSTKELKLKWKVLIVSFAAVLAFVFFTMFYDVLDVVIFSKASSASGVTRARWNLEALDAYNTSPIFGVGYKAIRGSSIIYTIMGELGILGLISFVSFNIASVWRVVFRGIRAKKYSLGYYGVLYAAISSVTCLVIACPDLDLCSYWFWLYLVSCYNGLELIKYRTNKIVMFDSFSQSNASLSLQ